MTVDVIIPTYKPDFNFCLLIEKLNKQTININKIIIMNTEEKYFDSMFHGSHYLVEHKNLDIRHISRKEFDHGKTRNIGASKSSADFMIFMTQDAIPESDMMIEDLLKPFSDPDVAVSYARQLPTEQSTAAERITREFNYPECSQIKSKEDMEALGIKTFFCSNVCCAYRRDIFLKQKGFINHTIFNEDMIYAAGVISAGYKVSYTANARVFHSHNYSVGQQFHRNFDLGVSQANHPEIFSQISSKSEGIKLVRITIDKLKEEHKRTEILPYIIMSGFKYMGYQFGISYKKLPNKLVRRCSMNKEYWK